MSKSFYNNLLSSLIGLAVGSLSGKKWSNQIWKYETSYLPFWSILLCPFPKARFEMNKKKGGKLKKPLKQVYYLK